MRLPPPRTETLSFITNPELSTGRARLPAHALQFKPNLLTHPPYTHPSILGLPPPPTSTTLIPPPHTIGLTTHTYILQILSISLSILPSSINFFARSLVLFFHSFRGYLNSRSIVCINSAADIHTIVCIIRPSICTAHLFFKGISPPSPSGGRKRSNPEKGKTKGSREKRNKQEYQAHKGIRILHKPALAIGAVHIPVAPLSITLYRPSVKFTLVYCRALPRLTLYFPASLEYN